LRIPIPRARGKRTYRISIAAVLALTACAPGRRASDVSAFQGKGAIIEVRNDRFDDIVVYLIRSGTQIELGVAPGVSRRAFALTPARLGGGGSVALGAGKRGVPLEQITAAFDLVPGRMAVWAIRVGGRIEQPIVR
jgi:hypothetical protein